MKWLSKILFVLFSIAFLFYLALPLPEFLDPPPESVRSDEPRDNKTEQLRGYYTNLTREEVQNHYRSLYKLPYGFDFLTVKLIHPPEDANSFVRHLIQSTHLVELVHPLRDSIYINEFITEADKGDNWFKGVFYSQKITVKIVQSSIWTRVLVGLLTIALIWFLTVEWARFVSAFVKELPRLKYVFKN